MKYLLRFSLLFALINASTQFYAQSDVTNDEKQTKHYGGHICDGLHQESNDLTKSSVSTGYITGWTEPYVIDLVDSTPYHMVIITDYNDVDEIVVSNTHLVDHTLNGGPITALSFLDDGIGNDKVAGDKMFTSADIVYTNPFNYQFPTGLNFRSSDVTYNFNNGTSDTLSIDLGYGIRMLRSDVVNVNTNVDSLDIGAQYSSHVVNFAVNLIGQEPLQNSATRTQLYYDYFPDTKDYLMLATSYATPGRPVASYLRVNVEETGTIYGYNGVNISSTFGSAGELNGVIKFYYSNGGIAWIANHEILHHYGTVLHPDLNLTIPGSHWNLIETNSSGFGSGWRATDIIDLGNDCYTREVNGNYTLEYNKLELYLMGLVPLSEVAWPLKTLVDFTFNGLNNPCPFHSTVGISEITQSDFEALMPPRVPNHMDSQKDFESALIVLTERLMTPLEMSYYNWQMEQNEMLIGDPNRNSAWSSVNFNEATLGLAILNTELPCPLIVNCDCPGGVQGNTFLGNTIYWNDASNWSLGTIPTLCDEVLIPAGLDCILLSTETGECYSIEVQVSGDFEVEQGGVLEVVAQSN